MTSGFPILAALLTPALLYGGAAAMSAPILIHLLARRRFKRIRWAAMDFLIDAERRNRRRIRMEDWILLALRCLGMFLIGLMLSRPFVRPAGLAAALGGSQQTERVFVLDDSFSMAYESPEGTSFARAKRAVHGVIKAVRAETPDDTVTILRMSDPADPIESGTFLSETQTAELFERLEALTPSQRSIDATAVIEGVVDVLERSPGVTNAAVYIISDFQRTDWIETETTDSQHRSKPGLLAPLAEWAGDGRGLRIVLIDVGPEQSGNTAVTHLEVGSGQLIAGTAGTIRAAVANHSGRDRDNLELQVTVGHLAQPSKTIRRLAARQEMTVDLEVEFLQAGFDALRIELAPDALPIDNVRYLAVEVAGAIRILIVNGEPSSDAYDDEVTFLATALRPEGEFVSGNETVIVDEAQLDDVNLTRFHLVVLANVYRISDPTIEALERFVRRGGGLLIFLGDQVDPDLYNAALYRSGSGMLPAELTQIVRPAGASHLVLTDRLHPAMRGFSREGDPLGLGQVPFFEYFGCVPYDGRDAPLEEHVVPGPQGEAETTSHARQGETARVIARFDDAEEHPAIVERRFGQGGVVLVTTSADKEWHFWPDHPTFLPLVMELTQYLARASDTGQQRHVGEPIELTLDPSAFESDVIVRTPGYPNEREVGLTATPADDGKGLTLNWDHTDQAGLYQFVLKRVGGGETVRLVAVNLDPKESDLAPANEAQLRRAMEDVPFEYVNSLDEIAAAAGETRLELWRLVLIGAALVLMFEQGLAWFWGRRR